MRSPPLERKTISNKKYLKHYEHEKEYRNR